MLRDALLKAGRAIALVISRRRLASSARARLLDGARKDP